jgi:hypothetical protein
MAKKLLVLVAMIAGLWGCGVKAPPVSWDTVIPKRIVTLEARIREGRLLLEWTAPKENTDNSPLTDLAGFQVLRSEGTLVGEECRGCGEETKTVFEMNVTKPEEAKGKRMSLLIEDLEPRKAYIYQVVARNGRDHLSAPSNPVRVFWDYPPRPPAVAAAERGDKRADLSWASVERATGYNVYRKAEGENYPLRPINREVLIETRYTDLNVENGKKYLYSIRTVRRVGKTDVEGKGSIDLPVIPADLSAPAAPTGLVAIPLPAGVELTWGRNQEPDLGGYYVFRRNVREPQFRRLNEAPVEKERFLDTAVQRGEEYEYAVSAVDRAARPNESPHSEEVRVLYPR